MLSFLKWIYSWIIYSHIIYKWKKTFTKAKVGQYVAQRMAHKRGLSLSCLSKLYFSPFTSQHKIKSLHGWTPYFTGSAVMSVTFKHHVQTRGVDDLSYSLTEWSWATMLIWCSVNMDGKTTNAYARHVRPTWLRWYDDEHNAFRCCYSSLFLNSGKNTKTIYYPKVSQSNPDSSNMFVSWILVALNITL